MVGHMDLADLTRKRLEHIQSCRTNNDNSHEIIASLYSDSSHFIYELLQNADDVGASEVIFNLTQEFLEIKHNGERLFEFSDVDSITTVGSSTKKDDINAIGTFGAGFKSVFEITKTPRIHSGDYHFKIVDFIVPKEIEPLDISKDTIIILPFNSSEISKDVAYQKISERLKSLESESLLFLRNIQEIQWITESEKGHYLSQVNQETATLISQINGQDNLKDYILFKKEIKIDGTKLNIAIAYLLDEGETRKIIPVNESRLFVFFPTNERIELKFLVHAPYKTTPGRESIPFDDGQNKAITQEISVLIAESIHAMKSKGLLDVDFLSVLPIEPEIERPLYVEAFRKVKNELQNNMLLPTSIKNYTSASDALLARGRELTSLLDASDCSILFGRNYWLNTEITYNKTRELRDYLIGILEIPEIDMEKFCREIDQTFIEKKSDQWIIDFYSNSTKTKALYKETYPKGILRKKPIIRLEDNSHINPEDEEGNLQAYLPFKSNRASKFKTVKQSIFNSEEASEFLRSLGLETADDIAEIKEFIIPKYDGNDIEKNDYLSDFEKVLIIYSQSDKYKRDEIVDLIGSSKFIRCSNCNNEFSYQYPENVYFRTEKINSWFKNNPDENIYFIDSESIKDTNTKFLKSLGVRDNLKVCNSKDISINNHGFYKRSINGFNPDFNIDGLDFSVENINLNRSIFLWNILLTYSNKLRGYLESKRNKNHPYKRGDEQRSKAMEVLCKHHWLFDAQSQLITKPLDQISLDDLSDEYNRENINIENLIKALGLKLDEIREFEEKTGTKVVSLEDHELLQSYKESLRKEKHEKKDVDNKEDWRPEVQPQEVAIVEDDSGISGRISGDLSAQRFNDYPKNLNHSKDNDPEKTDGKSNQSKNIKAIGEYGESIAYKYLSGKYPEYEVVWLNQNGNVGKGYDFLIKQNGKDIFYYEVKSKIEPQPKLFQISGIQWRWAQYLHKAKKGEMYNILIISNVGKKIITIKELSDPVSLWKTGKIFADPVNIEL